jgi:hypothetical protein
MNLVCLKVWHQRERNATDTEMYAREGSSGSALREPSLAVGSQILEDVWSRALMVHSYGTKQRKRYGPGSSRERHHE